MKLKKQTKRNLIFTAIILALSPLIFSLSAYLGHVILGEKNLKFHIEGIFGSTNANFRDVGDSINKCLGDHQLNPGVLLRANRQFSGWPCSFVGSPDKIYSLNFNHNRPRSYYCLEGLSIKKGLILNKKRFQDAEFLKKWHTDTHIRETSCKFIKSIMLDISNEEKVLVHCDAGRDRTGMASAVLAGVALEKIVSFDKIVSALECDYQKYPTLSDSYKGRITDFITDIATEYQNTENFLTSMCPSVNSDLINNFRKKLTYDAFK